MALTVYLVVIVALLVTWLTARALLRSSGTRIVDVEARSGDSAQRSDRSQGGAP